MGKRWGGGMSMTVSVMMHGALHEVSAFPDNDGSVSLSICDAFNNSPGYVTIFTGSPEAAREIYEALGPIFERHGGKAGAVHVRKQPAGGSDADPVA